MSGHSHWSSIKHQKSIADQKRGKIFSKLSREISVAAKEKGGDPDMNPSLRIIIEKAKKFNMPKENVEKAIKKGTGEIEGEKLESFLFEAYGPNNVAIIIEGIADNTNRALSEIKQILNQNNGKLANEGSVKWMFKRKGCVSINKEGQSKEELELKAIEAGAEDIRWQDSFLNIFTKVEDLEKVKKNLESQEIVIESTSVDWVAKDQLEVKDKEACEKLFNALDDNEGVQEIYSNLK